MNNVIDFNKANKLSFLNKRWSFITAIGIISGTIFEIRDEDSVILSDVSIYSAAPINEMKIINAPYMVLYWANLIGIIPTNFENGVSQE